MNAWCWISPRRSAVAPVLVALALGGCMKLTIVGVHCRSIEFGMGQWKLWSSIECSPFGLDKAEIAIDIETDAETPPAGSGRPPKDRESPVRK